MFCTRLSNECRVSGPVVLRALMRVLVQVVDNWIIVFESWICLFVGIFNSRMTNRFQLLGFLCPVERPLLATSKDLSY